MDGSPATDAVFGATWTHHARSAEVTKAFQVVIWEAWGAPAVHAAWLRKADSCHKPTRNRSTSP